MQNETTTEKNDTALKRWMVRTGTSGVTIGKRLGVSSTAVYKWANGEGRPTYDRALELYAITGIAVAELMRAPA